MLEQTHKKRVRHKKTLVVQLTAGDVLSCDSELQQNVLMFQLLVALLQVPDSVNRPAQHSGLVQLAHTHAHTHTRTHECTTLGLSARSQF